MSEASLRSIVELLADQGFAADKAAVRRIQRTDDPRATVEALIGSVPNQTIRLTEADVDEVLEGTNQVAELARSGEATLSVIRDMTGSSTGTGTYDDFVALFRDRYERLSPMLKDRVRSRSIATVTDAPQRHSVGVIGMIREIRSTSGGHWIIELEDQTGTCRCLVHRNNDAFDAVNELLADEIIGVEGSLSDDGELIFVETLFHPDVPRSHTPKTADRHVETALISDLHVGSTEFAAGAWSRFVDWLHTEEAASVEYLLIAGDIVEGVGVYPGQAAELSIVDIYEQYEAAVEELERVPADIEIAIIPGNHDAVRLAEPQPGFDDDLRSTLAVHEAEVISNPGWVELEGVTVLLYHGTSLDSVIAELPAAVADYRHPDRAMMQLLKKRHLAPMYGNRTRIAPESRDHLVIDEVPDIFHAGHTHTLGVNSYRNVCIVNSGCWQYQTPFQRRMNIDPDVGVAPIINLQTLDVTVRTFA